MKKIIAFSLWGDNKKYTIGALKNAKLAEEIYPGWICRFYIGSSVPNDIVQSLKSFENVEIVEMPEEGSWNSMFWRFLPIDDVDVEISLSRDCDSRLSIREKLCIDEFLLSDKLFHSMIDHPFHGGIMGGMWGIKKGLIENFKSLIDEWEKTDQWQTDQSFLNRIIKPKIENTWLLHDSMELKNFPTKRENYHYVGEIFDFEDNRFEQYCVFLPGSDYENF